MSDLTHPIRANARKDGSIGCLAVIAAGVLLFGAWYNLDLLTTWFQAIGYVGTVLFVALGLLAAAVILIGYWLATGRDCDGIDARTRAYNPEAVTAYHTVDDQKDHTGAIHYDGVYPDSVQVSVDGVRYEMDTRTGELR